MHNFYFLTFIVQIEEEYWQETIERFPDFYEDLEERFRDDCDFGGTFSKSGVYSNKRIEIKTRDINWRELFQCVENYVQSLDASLNPYKILIVDALNDAYYQEVFAKYKQDYTKNRIENCTTEEEKEQLRIDRFLRADKGFQYPVKFSNEMTAYIKELRHVLRNLGSIRSLNQVFSKCLLISMDDGWGYSAFLKEIYYNVAGYYEKIEASDSVSERYITSTDGLAEWQKQPAIVKELSAAIKKSKRCYVLAYDIRDWVTELSNPQLLDTFRKMGQYVQNGILVLRMPYMDIKVVRNIERTLSGVLSLRSLVIPPVSVENMRFYLREKLENANFHLDEDVDDILEQWICQEKNEGKFFGYKTLDKMAGELIYKKALMEFSVDEEEEDIACQRMAALHASDVQMMVTDVVGTEDAYELLNQLVGIAQVKSKIHEIVSQIKLQMALEAQGKPVAKPALHMMFLGNPGTGKTTVARIVGQIFKKEGILSKGLFFEKTGNSFVERYVGQTVQNVRSACRDAYGSVLFIDEAYGMDIGHSAGSTAEEIVPILIAEMENHREDMCVIFAGYEEEMKEFLKINSGLESRIPHIINFPNYTKEELIQIFFYMLDGNFDYEEELKEALEEYIESIPEDTLNNKEFSNARFVRNLYERLWGKAAYRMSLHPTDELILKKEDMVSVIEEEDFQAMVQDRPKRTIGFSTI